MKTNYSKLLLTVLITLSYISSGCKKWVIKEIEIKYQVTASTTERPFDVFYANDINGEDVVRDTATLLWEKTYIIESDTAYQREFYMYVYCYELYGSGVSQTITTRIYEDGDLVAEEYSGGIASIGSDKTWISAFLPSKNRYVEKKDD